MKPLLVDFAPRRVVPNAVWWTLSLILLLVAGEEGWRGWQLFERARAVEVQLAAANAARAESERAAREAQVRPTTPPPYAQDAQAIARMARFPLQGALHALENVQVQGVRVLSLDAAAAEGTVAVEFEFADSVSIGVVLDALNAGEPSSPWALQRLLAQTSTATKGTARVVFRLGP